MHYTIYQQDKKILSSNDLIEIRLAMQSVIPASFYELRYSTYMTRELLRTNPQPRPSAVNKMLLKSRHSDGFYFHTTQLLPGSIVKEYYSYVPLASIYQGPPR